MGQKLLGLEVTTDVEVDHVLRKARVGTERLELITQIHREPRSQLLYNLKPVNPAVSARIAGVSIASLECGQANKAGVVEQLKFEAGSNKVIVKIRTIDGA